SPSPPTCAKNNVFVFPRERPRQREKPNGGRRRRLDNNAVHEIHGVPWQPRPRSTTLLALDRCVSSRQRQRVLLLLFVFTLNSMPVAKCQNLAKALSPWSRKC
ncbi:unnamed protein product, partial [Ectocarpus sp. 13 AM-2016]